MADNITELTVERTNINTIVQVEGANNITFESVEPFDSNRSLKLFIKLDKNNRSYSQTSYISVRNTNITIDYNYDDGTEEEA